MGVSGSNVVYLEFGFGFLLTASNQMCSTMHGPLCKCIPGLNQGRNSSRHSDLAWECSDGRMKLHKQQSYSKQNWSNCSGPADSLIMASCRFLCSFRLLLLNLSSAIVCHEQGQRSAPKCHDTRNNSIGTEKMNTLILEYDF